MIYFCCAEKRRRNEIDGRTDTNGIDFLEVLDERAQPAGDRQRTLFVHFINDPSGLVLAKTDVAIEGGERIRDIRVADAKLKVDTDSGSTRPVLVVVVDRPGDFSTYTLRLLPGDPATARLLDPMMRAVDFSFKVGCETKFDPKTSTRCPPSARSEPTIDYLARDYTSFRQLLRDRVAVLVPDWTERSPADLGVALVELAAYVGDHLSYRQDAAATEAYLGTCRLRTSARRHARLVDYFMHDGCNARTWMQVRLREESSPVTLEKGTLFYTAVTGVSPRIGRKSAELTRVRESGAVCFQSMFEAALFPEHDRMRFHSWGARQCCLPKGAVRATLRGALPNLKAGMVLVFQETLSPRTGDKDDADITHRHAVRLTEVTPSSDPLGGCFDDPPTSGAVDVTEVRWADEDALPMPFCISAETSKKYNSAYVQDVTVALGNIVLADHGAPESEELSAVPQPSLEEILAEPAEADTGLEACRRERTRTIEVRFRPELTYRPITQAVRRAGDETGSARYVMDYDPKGAVPQVWLTSTGSQGTGVPWDARLDLLDSKAESKDFVVEVEADGRSRLRCGDGANGARPAAGTLFTVDYRVGNGEAGNVGAESIAHIVSDDDGVETVTNPLAARGGVEMETIDEVRQHAPCAYRPQTLADGRPDGRTLERAVTARDYAAICETRSDVQRAVASFRWTGSWHTAFVTVDPTDGRPVDDAFERELRDLLDGVRLAGRDVEIEPPRAVALEIAIRVRLKPGYFASDVRRELLDVLGNRTLPDGTRGVFHPDNLTFGQTVYLSPIYAAVQGTDGVDSVDITTFQRRDRPGTAGRDAGSLTFGALEIPRLDNDPDFPERGTLTVTLEDAR